MAVTEVRERFEGRRSGYRDGKSSHTRVFLVKCSDIQDGTAAAIVGDDGTRKVPTFGSRHPVDGAACVTGLDASPVNGSGQHFEVTVEYTGGSFIIPSNPLDRPAEITYGNSDGTETYFTDKTLNNPKRVCNSAGDTFESFLERDTGESNITITNNEATHNPLLADAYRHTVNLGPVTIDGVTYPAGTLKLAPITAVKMIETYDNEGVVMPPLVFYKRTYNLRFRAEGWKDKVLDVGFNEFIADPTPGKAGKLKPIVDATSQKLSKPWPLNGSGRKKSQPTDDPATLEFQPYAAVSWADLAFTNPDVWEV